MKKKVILSLVLTFVFLFSIVGNVFASGTWDDCTYKSFVGGDDCSDKMINRDGYTYSPMRWFLEKFGFIVDFTSQGAMFDAMNYGNEQLLENAGVDFYAVDNGEYEPLGTGFFIRGSKIFTTYTVQERANKALGEQKKIKARLYLDGTYIDVENFRSNGNRLLSMCDSKGYTSKFVAKLAKKNGLEGQQTTLITSTQVMGNDLLVQKQVSHGKILKTNYEYDSNGILYSLINNKTDERINGINGDYGDDTNKSIGGAVYNQFGEIIGIFDKVDDDNNGDVFTTTVFYMHLFLADELD